MAAEKNKMAIKKNKMAAEKNKMAAERNKMVTEKNKFVQWLTTRRIQWNKTLEVEICFKIKRSFVMVDCANAWEEFKIKEKILRILKVAHIKEVMTFKDKSLKVTEDLKCRC